MPFDVDGALRAGYSLADIANFLGEKEKFDVNAARQAGYSDSDIVAELQKGRPKPTAGGYVKEFFKGIPSGGVNLLESAAVGASAVLPEELEKPLREGIKSAAEAARKPFAAAPGYEGSIPRTLGEATGSTVPFFLTGPVGAATLGVAAGAGEARTAAEAKGASGEDRALATILGMPVGVLDIVAPELKIGRTIISRALATGGVEGATEAAQRIAQNLIAKGVYDPEKPIFVGAGEEGAYGAGAGALTRLLLDMALGRRGGGGGAKPGEEKPGAEPAPTPTGLPPTATQLPLGGVPEFGPGYEGYRGVPESYRQAEELDADRQNKLRQIVELRDQHDVLMRELDRLKTQYEGATEAQRQEILTTAEPLNEARISLEEQINEVSQGVEGTERAGVEGVPGQAALDFDMPAMPRQRTGEGVVLGEEPTVPEGLTQDQEQFFKQARINDIQSRIAAGQPVTLADTAFLSMMQRENLAVEGAKPVPEISMPEERPDFRLGPQYLEPTTPMPEVAETRPVTEADFKVMGIGKTNKKLREAILGKDLADPEQRAEVKDVLTDYANNPNRSAKVIEGVNGFLTSPTFMEQGELDLRQPRKRRAKAQEEVTNVVESGEPIGEATEPSPAVVDERGDIPAGGVEAPVASGMDVAGEPTGQPDVGEGTQPAALTPKEATAKLVEGGLSPAEAREAVSDLVDGYGNVSSADVKAHLQSTVGAAPAGVGYTPEQRQVAEGHAADLGGKVVWQQGDLALVRGYSALSGSPVYVATKGDLRTRSDVESYKGNLLTAAERARLVGEKKLQEKTAEDTHKKKPFITFDSGNIQTSKNVPKGLKEVIDGWAKLLGVHANIYVTTVEDARADVDKFTGPYRAIGSAALDPLNAGTMRRMSNGVYYISFTASTSKTSMLEVLAHELGHVHMKEKYNSASPELQKSIRSEFERWLVNQKGKTARELVNNLRAKTSAKQTTVPEGKMADDLRSYWRSFDEWYADQVARWATTDARPISVVEKFFARLGRALRTFFGNIKNKRYLANETFVQYLDKVKDAAVRADTDVADTGGPQAQRKTTEDNLSSDGERAAALNERMKNIGNEPEPDVDLTFKERLMLQPKRFEGIGMKIRQAVVDKDAPVKEQLNAVFQNKLRDAAGDVVGYVANEQAQEAAGLADQLMRRGGIRLTKDGLFEVYDRVENGERISIDRVFEIVIEDLGNRLGSAKTAVTLAHRSFIAQRANELNKRNETLRQQAEAAEAKGNTAAAKKLRAQIIKVRASQEEIDAGLEAMQEFPELKKAFDVFTKANEEKIDFLVATDRISPAEAQEWKDNIGYVPWTRVEEEETKLQEFGKLRSGNVHLAKLPQLDKEGSSKEIRNILDNMVGNTIWAVRSGLKNRAAIKTLDQLPTAIELKTQDELDAALADKATKHLVVYAYRDGERVAFRLENEIDLPAFSTVVDSAGMALGAFRAAATGLRSFVTHMPTFALSQLSQDTVRAMFLSGVKHPFSLPTKVMKNFVKSVTGDVSDIQALGITGAYDGMPEHAMQRARERHGLQERALWRKAWDKLEHFSLSADMAVRAAIYEQTMQETGDRVLAFHRAKEYINFKTGGNDQTVRTLRQIVPFMNAYIQGMDVLYRTIQGKGLSMEDRRTAIALFATTGMKVAALSMLYAALVGDDDDYKGLDDYERDKNFIIPGTGLKIPVAPEIGFLFKVIPERMLMAMSREGTDREIDSTTFMRGMRDAFINSYGGVSLTPQLVKPVIEVATNYSFFTGTPIVGLSMGHREVAEQFTDRTSEIAKLFGAVGISPMKVDHLLRGYLGTLGGVILDVTDAVADPNRMSKPINKLPLVSTFMYDDTGRGYKSEFYAFREEVDRVTETVNAFKREGRAEELQKYLTEDKIQMYAMQGIVGKIEEQLGKLRQYRNIISQDANLSPDEKREQVDNILRQEKEILQAYNVPRLRKLAGM